MYPELQTIGLPNAELAVYVALLELDESTSGPLIAKTNLQSSVIHRALKNLIQKGLISYVKRGKNNHYRAADPENLVHFIENKKKQILDILPKLQALHKTPYVHNSVEMYEGKRSVFALLNSLVESLEPKTLFCSFSLIEPHDDKEIIRFYKQFNRRRVEKKLQVKVLANKRVKDVYEKHYTVQLLQKAHVRYSHFEFPQGLIIVNNIIIFLSWSHQPFAIKVINTDMAEQYRNFFLDFYEREEDHY